MRDDRRWLAAIFILILTLTSASIVLTGCAAPVATAALANVETGVDPAAWTKVPAGEFVLGQHEDAGMVAKPYEIMLTDATNDQYARYLNEALAKGTGGRLLPWRCLPRAQTREGDQGR
jgi:hypothetical protein